MSTHTTDLTVRARRAVAAALLAGATLSAGELSAQSLWSGPSEQTIQLELLRPDFSQPLAFVGATAASFATVRLPLNEALRVVGELPYARATWETGQGGRESAALIGNPYLGVAWQGAGRVSAEAGVRLPTAQLDDLETLGAMLVGMAGEVDRIEAFAPETLGFYAAAGYRAPLARGVGMRFRTSAGWLSEDGGPGELLVGYAGQLRYEAGRSALVGGISGRANATTDDVSADRFRHQAVLGGDLALGAFRPALQVRVPLDRDMRELAGYTVSVGLGWSAR